MNEEIQFAGFWSRTLATIIDTIWLYGIIYTVLFILIGEDLLNIDSQYSMLQFTFEWVIPLIVVMVFWVKAAATPGKMLLHMKIVDAQTYQRVSSPRLLLRYMAYFVSMIPLFLGIFWVAWDKKKQGWHDKIAGTVIVKYNKA